MTIDECIADAKAEEEVKKSYDFNKTSQDVKKEATVTINLNEYTALAKIAMDFKRIMYAIVKDARLSYDNDHLIIDGDEVEAAFRILNPDLYQVTHSALLEKAQETQAKEDKEVKAVWDKDDEEGE